MDKVRQTIRVLGALVHRNFITELSQKYCLNANPIRSYGAHKYLFTILVVTVPIAILYI